MSDVSCLWTVHVMDVVSVQVFSNCVFHFSEGRLSTAPLSSTPWDSKTWLQPRLAFCAKFVREVHVLPPSPMCAQNAARSFRATADVGNCRATHPTDLAGDLSSAMLGP